MSSRPQTRIVFGTEHRTPDTFYIEDISPSIALGTTPGNAISIAKKRDDNEDAAAWVDHANQGALALLADAHFGADSAHIAIEYVKAHHSPNTPDLLRQMLRLHLEIDHEIRSHQHLKGRFKMTSATTLISCFFRGTRGFYCNSGDSCLLRLRNGKLENLTPIRPVFLGNPEPLTRSLALFLENHCAETYQLYQNQPYQTLYELACQLRKQKCPEPLLGKDLIPKLDPRLKLQLDYLVDQCLPHFGAFKIQQGDTILLASDGITPEASALEKTEIQDLLNASSQSAAQSVEALLKATVGDDNLTVIVYKN